MFTSKYIPKYFKAQELVSPEYFEIWQQDALNLFDPHTLRMLDRLRADFGKPIVINNYDKGFIYSGLRPPNCSTGASRSWHKRAVAFDLKTDDIKSLQEFLTHNSELYFIARIENFKHTPTWCHIEISTELVEETKYFNP